MGPELALQLRNGGHIIRTALRRGSWVGPEEAQAAAQHRRPCSGDMVVWFQGYDPRPYQKPERVVRWCYKSITQGGRTTKREVGRCMGG